MSFARFARSAVTLGTFLAVVFAGVGCQPSVREDRTIHVDSDGRAAFQHGQNGVFVTDPKTGVPKRIYEPTPDDIAVSPPAWEPGGKRMVFTVARSLDGKRPEPLGDTPADGRRYSAIPVKYTCFLHDPAANGTPQKLFEANVGHAGYIAAGLGVSWHPGGKRLDFVQRDGDKHRVRTFDIATKRTADVPLPVAENVALGSAPNRPARYAILGGAGADNGLWIEGAGDAWRRVPSSEPQTAQLEDLRRRLPQWSRNGAKLAFTDGIEVRVCDAAARTTETWFRAAQKQPEPKTFIPQQVTALHWHPDGTRLGILDGTRLGLVTSSGWQKTLTEAPVVAFAGWSAAGTRVAYTTGEPLPYSESARWATFFIPNTHARTAIRVADADGANEKVLLSGLRATFPHWSPGESRLSVWLTVEPPYRLASLDRLGMQPGDPAALIDPETGKLDWLPVNGTEHAQIGHVELRTGRIDAALKRFDEAGAGLRVDEKADWVAFRAIALQKAGRADAAKEAWKRFEPAAPRRAAPASVQPGQQVPVNAEAITVRHRFIAEAFVSLEMVGEGIDYFREQVKTGTEADRLSAAVALCQLLLLADRKAEYAECATDHLLPLAGKVMPKVIAGQEALGAAVAWTLLPLAASDFAAALPEAAVRRVSEKATAPAGAEDVDFACQLVLRACGQRLKDEKLTEGAQARLTNHPARPRWNLTSDEVDAELLSRVQAAFLLQEALREAFGADLTFRPE